MKKLFNIRLGKFENDILIYALGKGLIGLATFLFIPVLTRSLGIEKYGSYSLTLTFIILCGHFTSGWLQQSLLRFHTIYINTKQHIQYLNTVKSSTIIIGLLGFLITSFGVFYIVDDIYIALCAGLLCFFWILYNIVIAISQSLLLPKHVIISDILRTSLPFLLLIILLYTTNIIINISYTFLIIGTGLLVGFIYQLYFLEISWLWNPIKNISCTVFKKLFQYGIPVSFWLSISILQVFIGRYAIEFFGFDSQLGIYTTFQDISVKAGTLIFIPIIYAIHPRIMVAWNDKDIEYCQSLFKKGIMYFFILSVVFIVTASIFYTNLLSMLFTKQELVKVLSIGSKGLFLLFVLSEGLNQLSLISHKGLEVSNNTIRMVIILLSCVVLNLILLILLIKPLGVYGVVTSLILSRLVYVIITGSYSLRKFRI